MSTAPGRRSGPFGTNWSAYLYIAPALVVFIAMLGVPLFQTASYSLYEWNGFAPPTWVGLDNYAELMGDTGLRTAFVHAAVLVVFYAVIPVLVALVIAGLLSRAARLRGLGVFRTMLFLPQVVASVVVASSWMSIYAPDGALNQALRAVGLDRLTKAWLGDFSTALPAVGFIGTWLGIGLCLVLFLSGVGAIDSEVFEAARLDGANAVQEFFAITLPAIRGQIAVALTLTTISAIKTFDLVYVTTRGGPGESTRVPAYVAYSKAFVEREVGMAAAVALVLTVVVLLISMAISRLSREEAA